MSQFVGSRLKWTVLVVRERCRGMNLIFQTKLNGYSRRRFRWQILVERNWFERSKLDGKIRILDFQDRSKSVFRTVHFEPDVWMKISVRLTLTFLISWLIGLWSLIRAITVSIFRVESWNCWKSVFKTISELWNCVYKTANKRIMWLYQIPKKWLKKKWFQKAGLSDN